MSIADRQGGETRALGTAFSEEYKAEMFLMWYNRGKPDAQRLYGYAKQDPLTNKLPTVGVLQKWIDTEFVPKALDLDQQVADRIEQAAIGQKLEMLDRHAALGKEMQEMGIQYLRQEGVKSAKDAITLLVRGLEAEENARVVSTDILKRINDMSDEKLLDELKKVATGGNIIDVSPIDVE